jgi:NTP pyrophosphatase (non-canonical NTP hydrolase)
MIDSENLCRKAMEIYGFPAQAAMVVEECSELTNAICKFRRGRVGNDDIITEIADVMIMCEQLSYYFGKEKVELEKERKLERLKERLSKYTD